MNEQYNQLSSEEILSNVYSIVQSYFDDLNEYDPELRLEILKVELYGSRTRGTNEENSDLDVLVEYQGNMKEDSLFNILNENVYSIAGMKLDINPIRAIESGTIEDYLKRDEQRRITLEKQRLLVDMDGVLAKFKKVDTLEKLYENGYFMNLEPIENVVAAIKQLIVLHPEIDVYIMSSVLSDSKYALDEKNAWLDIYLPEIDIAHRIFPPCGENKLDYVPEGIRSNDCLLDDYTHNLTLWEPPAKGIKLLNGINHTHQTWKGSMVSFESSPEELVENIVEIMGKVPVYNIVTEEKPVTEKKNHASNIVGIKVDELHLNTKKEMLIREYRDIREIQGRIQNGIADINNLLNAIEEKLETYVEKKKEVFSDNKIVDTETNESESEVVYKKIMERVATEKLLNDIRKNDYEVKAVIAERFYVMESSDAFDMLFVIWDMIADDYYKSNDGIIPSFNSSDEAVSYINTFETIKRNILASNIVEKWEREHDYKLTETENGIISNLERNMDISRDTFEDMVYGVLEELKKDQFYEDQLLYGKKDMYGVYQPKDADLLEKEFVFDSLRKKDYELVYLAPLDTTMSLESICLDLEAECPLGYKGDRFKRGNVLVLHKDKKNEFFFYDTYGAIVLPEFSAEEQEKEQDINSIKDEISGPKL